MNYSLATSQSHDSEARSRNDLSLMQGMLVKIPLPCPMIASASKSIECKEGTGTKHDRKADRAVIFLFAIN